MQSLTEIQIIYIKKDLKSKKTASGFRPEVLDHLCCMVESKLNEGLDFATAYTETIAEFSAQGFIALTNQSAIIKKKRMIVSTQLMGAMLAASVFMFVFGVGAQAPPNINPIPNGLITSSFGMRFDPISKKERLHTGVDLKSAIGTPIVASGDGEIVFAGVAELESGKKIIIYHDQHFETTYSHLSEIKVKEGQIVKQGDIIGLVGITGRTTGPHLHYEVLQDGVPVDPATYMAQEE